MEPNLSIALCVRNDEARLPAMVRGAIQLARRLESSTLRPVCEAQFGFEVLALDERSHDNSLSALSLLQARVPELRCIQDLAPGTALQQAARTARGRYWLFADSPIDEELGLWAVEQLFCGYRASLVPGELLALERELGQHEVSWPRGGLLRAQHEVTKALKTHGDAPVRAAPRDRSVRARASRILRGRAARLGFARFDRPKK